MNHDEWKKELSRQIEAGRPDPVLQQKQMKQVLENELAKQKAMGLPIVLRMDGLPSHYFIHLWEDEKRLIVINQSRNSSFERRVTCGPDLESVKQAYPDYRLLDKEDGIDEWLADRSCPAKDPSTNFRPD